MLPQEMDIYLPTGVLSQAQYITGHAVLARMCKANYSQNVVA